LPDLADLTLREAAEAMAAGDLTAAELTGACLARAAATEDLGAFAVLCPDEARRDATARDRERADGRARGALHGVPTAIKDLVDVAGLPTRAGSHATDDAPAARDAPVVGMLRDAGAVITGKTATHEFGYGTTTRGTRNPWGRDRLAGGSSGGSAVAVAIGACPLALGSDTAGSCRIPAALCGVAGMMGRPGRLPLEGAVALAPGLDAIGFLARTAADLALAWTALTGEAVDAGPAGPPALRVATPPEAALGPVEPEALEAADAVAESLARGGGRRATAPVPVFSEFARPRGTLIGALALAAHRERGWWPGRAERYGPAVAGELRAGEAVTEDDVRAARERLAALAAELRAALEGHDVLVLPVTPGGAPRRDDGEPLEVSERRHAADMTRLNGPVNIAGLAAVSIFGGFDRAGVPLGVQVVARDEVTALAAAAAYEVTAGPAPRPPLIAGAGAGLGREGEGA
jgi:aspartyl-tRNA(Asn)/glutamyl-tRNA(Gln) amidotransferase subunit A